MLNICYVLSNVSDFPVSPAKNKIRMLSGALGRYDFGLDGWVIADQRSLSCKLQYVGCCAIFLDDKSYTLLKAQSF